jgi:hypothetical protein
MRVGTQHIPPARSRPPGHRRPRDRHGGQSSAGGSWGGGDHTRALATPAAAAGQDAAAERDELVALGNLLEGFHLKVRRRQVGRAMSCVSECISVLLLSGRQVVVVVVGKLRDSHQPRRLP